MSKNMLRNQAFLRDSLEVISDWRLLTFCSVILLRNTVLMFQNNLQTCFDVGEDVEDVKDVGEHVST